MSRDWNSINTEQIKAGDQKEINRLYKILKPFLMFRHQQNEEEFNDVVIKIVSHINQYDPASGGFDNWILKISDNVKIDSHRKYKKHKNNISLDDAELNHLLVEPETIKQEERQLWKIHYDKIFKFLNKKEKLVMTKYLEDVELKEPRDRVQYYYIKQKITTKLKHLYPTLQ